MYMRLAQNRRKKLIGESGISELAGLDVDEKMASQKKEEDRILEIVEKALTEASAHPFENIQSLLPPISWLGLHPVPDHRRDAARAENSLTLSFGSELIDM
ncbi:hypothetical protein L1887_34107 [Cichorium endivia]|nr:hypothetical protein L1887_34107 [Cichorium endivia]